MTNRPKAWLAVLLGLVFAPFALLYVGRWKWAIAAAVFMLGLVGFQLALGYAWEWLTLFVQLVFVCAVSRIAYLQANRFDEDRVRPAYSRWYGLCSILLLFVMFAITFRAFLYEPFRAPAGSMLPSLKPGASLIVQKRGYGNYGTYGFSLVRSPVSAPVERGDILVFEYPPKRSLHYIKRIIGLPGDKIEYRNKVLSINGQTVAQRAVADYFDESSLRYLSQYIEKLGSTEYAILTDKERPAFIPGASQFPHANRCTYDVNGVSCVVPDGHYYAMGDHRDNSLDSRYWGFVPRDHLVGKLVHAIQPL